MSAVLALESGNFLSHVANFNVLGRKYTIDMIGHDKVGRMRDPQARNLLLDDFADFRKITTVLTAAELQSTALPFYRRWTEVKSVPSAERLRAHIDNMFRLLREDMLAEIRQELQLSLGIKKITTAAPGPCSAMLSCDISAVHKTGAGSGARLSCNRARGLNDCVCLLMTSAKPSSGGTRLF